MLPGRAPSSIPTIKTRPNSAIARKRTQSTIANPSFPSKKSNTRLTPDMDTMNANTNNNSLAAQRPMNARTQIKSAIGYIAQHAPPSHRPPPETHETSSGYKTS